MNATATLRALLIAAIALLAAVLTVGLAVVMAITDFPQGLGVLGCVAVALVAAWSGLYAVGGNARWGSRSRC